MVDPNPSTFKFKDKGQADCQRQDRDEDVTDIFDSSLSALFDVAPIAFSTSSPSAAHVYYPPFLPSSTSSHSSSSPSLVKPKPYQIYLPQPPASLFATLQANNLWLSAVYLSDSLSLRKIDVRGQSVAELGAGASLPSIVALRDGGARVVISSDWGVEQVVSVIEKNFEINCGSSNNNQSSSSQRHWAVVGHEWGTDPTHFLNTLKIHDPNQHQPTVIDNTTPISTSSLNQFDTLLLADTLWVTSSHQSLLTSIFSLLRPGGIAHIAAGLHTGRGPVNRFVSLAKERGAVVTFQKEAKWSKGGGWVQVDTELDSEAREKGCGLEEERGVVVYYTLRIPESNGVQSRGQF